MIRRKISRGKNTESFRTDQGTLGLGFLQCAGMNPKKFLIFFGVCLSLCLSQENTLVRKQSTIFGNSHGVAILKKFQPLLFLFPNHFCTLFDNSKSI